MSFTRWRSLVDGTEVDVGPAIPDSEVYLQDDWGDNKLTNRDDSGTTTYNGVEGVYRPEWTLEVGTPTASNQKIRVDDGELAYAGINLNLDETVTWEWSGVESTSDSDTEWLGLGLFAETAIPAELNFNTTGLEDGYHIACSSGGNFLRLYRLDGGTATELAETDPGVTGWDNESVTATRSPSGEFEVFVNGTSEITATDTTFTAPENIAFATRDEDSAGEAGPFELSVDEVKVS